MKYAVNIPNINLDFSVPQSKSVVHRQLIISFLLQTLNSVPDKAAIREIIEPLPTDNDDIRATRGCLKALYEASCAVDGRDILMPCNESGSTLRFMMSVGAAFLSYKGLSENKHLVFQPKGKLLDRPLDQLIECLASHGVSVVIDKQAGTITESGNLTEGVFEIQGNISSQYISGLLMALVLLPNSSVKLIGALESKGYFELTISTLESFGIKINELNGLFTINTISALCENKNMAEGDWSSASFLLCLGTLAKKSRVVLNGLNKNSIQKDKVIVEILSKLGIKTGWNGNSISLDMMSPENKSESTVQDFQTETLVLDASDYPDIVPYIAVVAAARAKLTKMKNVERLRFKECDRVEATIKALAAVGVKAEELDGTLVIHGGLSCEHGTQCEPSPADTRDSAATKLADVCDTPSIETFGDHRMAMTACLIAAWTGQTVYIDNKDCVNKSFPGLFELIEKGIAMANINNTYNWFKGDKLKIGIYGESHSESIGVRLEGLEYDKLDTDALKNFMKRRAPGQNAWSTPRKEADDVIVDTLKNGLFEAHILNTNTKPHDYSNLLITPRPGHADFTARLKYGESFMSSGGGSFSGRLTAPLCAAGFLALSYLAQKGIRISAHIKSIAGISDKSYSFDSPVDTQFLEELHKVTEKEFPVIDDEKGNLMKQKIAEARAVDDSVGGVIEVVIEGVPGGIGGPIFEGIEGKIASICFAVPACKGVEFGNGFAAAALRGSQNNDSLVFADTSENTSLRLKTNRCGGILGGISVGGSVAPIVFEVAVKPTPTIAMEQQTVDLATKQNTTIKVQGRHDPCIVPRAVPVYEAAAALALADLI